MYLRIATAGISERRWLDAYNRQVVHCWANDDDGDRRATRYSTSLGIDERHAGDGDGQRLPVHGSGVQESRTPV